MANPSRYLRQLTPCSAATEGNEFSFRGLYLHRIYSGEHPNQWEYITRSQSGSLCVHNWPIRDGIGQNARVIAHAKGLHISGTDDGADAADCHQSFTIVFEDERFKGSTLQVMGMHVAGPDWAIVGGTGHFAMATGVINKRAHQKTAEGIITTAELTIQGFCPLLKGSSKCFATKIGPWGGNGGSAKDITEAPKRLESVTVRSGWVVDSIAFSYVDQAGQKRTAGPWGGNGGIKKTIQLTSSEFVKEVSGTFDVYEGCKVINSLKLVTNCKTHGPFGLERGTPFSVPVHGNSGVVGFFARAGKYLDAVGVYVHPL